MTNRLKFKIWEVMVVKNYKKKYKIQINFSNAIALEVKNIYFGSFAWKPWVGMKLGRVMLIYSNISIIRWILM